MKRLAILVVSLGMTSSASAQCMRWANLLSDNDFVGSGPHTEKELAYARQMMYSDNYRTACEKYFRKSFGQGGYGKITYSGVTDIYAACTADTCPNDNVANCFITTSAFYQGVTRQPCCSENVRGPYADLGGGGHPPYSPDGSFTGSATYNAFTGATTLSGQKGAIYTDHRIIHHLGPHDYVRSDIGSPPDYWDALDYASKTEIFGVEDDPYYSDLIDHTGDITLYNPDGAQIDHIIPRVDINGCACGTNSYGNALVISAKLNNEMRNYCDNPIRQQIIASYPNPTP